MKLQSILAQSYYSAVLMMLLTVVALVISIIHYRRHRNLRIFTYYAAFSLLQDICGICAAYSFKSHWNFWIGLLIVVTYGFLLLEFIACNLFILCYIDSPLRRRIIRISGLLFFGVLIFTTAKSYPGFNLAYWTVPQFVFLVFPCLIYFYEFFSTATLRPLRDQPAFWVVSGILFVHAGDLPFMLTANFLGRYLQAAYTVNYVLYSIFFILLSRAYLCPRITIDDAAASSRT